MRSKTSCFNKTLFLKNLTRFWPLWGGASFIGALFSLALLSQLLRYGKDSIASEPLEMTLGYYGILSGLVPIICLLYGLLCALAVWGYLYSARSVNLMHILPIRREGLFVTNFLSGYVMLLLPFAVTGGLCIVISAVFGLFEPVGVLVTILGVLGESFFYFSSATLAAFITGNIFAMPALYLLLHFLEAILDLLLSNFARGFIFGLSTNYTGFLEFLSPTVYLMRNVDADAQYQKTIIDYTGAYTHELLSVRLENAWLIAVYALAGAALLALAFVLYRRRRSERAGEVVAVGWMRPFFRYGVAGLAALLGGQLIYGLFWEDAYFKAVPLAVCMLVAGAIGYYGASMLLAKTLRVFHRSWRGLALVAAGVAVLCGCLRLDLFRAADRVPEISQIEKMEFYADSNTYIFYPGREDELLERVRRLHAAIAADRKYVLDFDRENFTTLEDETPSWTWEYVSFTYTTHGGQTVHRNYSVPMTRERLGQSGAYDSLLDGLVNSQEMRLKRIHASGDGYEPCGGRIYLNRRNESSELSDREAAAILEAVTRDAQAGRWGHVEWLSTEAWNSGTYALQLSLEFSGESDDTWDWIDIAVRPEMTATTACLLELGLVTNEDLSTNGELYPEEYGRAGAADSAPAEAVYPETTSETVVIGVAG
ncbi:ABC transporter permease [Oscillibacter sp.]|jgi:ABC-2 type transport system permease protein|uniref:ABC transporter permease n=1 Tax=Oscillibacter sp. TaxID=1945593 RepID=UPI00260C9E35|nr:ABC transporter permease [Oscillibacter sp.]